MKKLFFALLILILCATTVTAQTDVTNTGILYINGSSDIFFAGNNFINNTGSALTNNGHLHINGNATNNESSMAVGSGTLYFDGSSAQVLDGAQPFRTFDFVSNNSAGITLNNDLHVNGVHTFTSGIITTSATPNYLVYQAGSSYSGSGDTRHVNGWVKKLGSTSFIFPVGNGTYERSVALTGLTASSEFNARYLPTTPDIYSTQLPIRMVDMYEYWVIDKVSGGSASVELNWDKSKVYFPNWIISDLAVAEYNGSAWTDQGGTAIGNVATTGTITSNSVSVFNYFAIGSKSWVLPLTLTNFAARRQDNYTQISWSTANEYQVKQYIVERSDDSRSFYTIGQAIARNSGNKEQYESRDNAAIHQTAYYRLRTIDKDGRETLSRVVTVTEKGVNTLVLLTNPVHDQVKLLASSGLSGVFQYQLHSTNGQLVQTGTLTIQNGGHYELPLKGGIIPGTYTLKLNNGQQSFAYKLLVL